MNRFISIGLSIAVAPALLLAYGRMTDSRDTVEVASFYLLAIALPLGALLVAVGLLIAAKRRIPPSTPKRVEEPRAPAARPPPRQPAFAPETRTRSPWLGTARIKRLAYWMCLALVLLPMIYQAIPDGAFPDNPSEGLWHLGKRFEAALLLISGGLVSPYFFGFYLPRWLSLLLVVAGIALILRRLSISVRDRSLAPPASYRGLASLLSGFALGFWIFHAFAEFTVPPFYQFSLVIGFLARSGDYAVGFLMAWFWLTELRSLAVPWPARGH